MFCGKCGNQVHEGDAFCTKCGAALHENAGQSTNVEGCYCQTETEKKVEEMTQYCLNNYTFVSETAINRNAVEKNTERILRCYFKAIEKEIQSDEEELLCFSGNHNFKSKMRHLGPYGYVLTNRRLIMAGACGSNADSFNYYQIMRYLFSKNFSCRMKSIYLKDLKNVTEDMVAGKDILRFETEKDTFNVMFPGNNVTHRLCSEIQGILDSLKAEA